MKKDLSPSEKFSLEDYLRLKEENSKLMEKIRQLEAENLKLKSKKPFQGGVRVE